LGQFILLIDDRKRKCAELKTIVVDILVSNW